MCVAMAGLAAGATLLGAGISAVGQLKEGADAKAIADSNAKLMINQGRYEAKQIRRKLSYVNANAQVTAAGWGSDMGGSVLDVMADNAGQAELDAIATLDQAQQRAEIEVRGGEAAQTQAMFGAVGSIIGGFSKFAGMQQ